MSDLVLSDFEKGFLTAHFEAHLCFEMEWVGVQVLGRMFDICIHFAEKPDPQYPQDLVAKVYECHPNDDGEYQTNVDKVWFIKEVAA